MKLLVLPIFVSLAALLAVLGTVALWNWSPGIVLDVEGTPCWGRVSVAAPLRRCATQAAQQSLSSTVWLQADEQVLELPATALGFELDEAAFIEQLDAVLIEEKERAHQWSTRIVGFLLGEVRERSLNITTTFRRTVAEQALVRMAPGIKREPQNAKLMIADHKINHAIPGRQLSVAASLARLQASGWKSHLVIQAAVDSIEPQVQDKDLTPVDITQVLSSYETSFKGKAGPRGTNIKVAARYLNGAVILPGETLSFNRVVGRRVHGRGFVDAPVIVNDELVQDVGGGVCQVTTTLHGAAVFGNLDIVRRRSHSRPSGYAPVGLDATVIDGQVDFRIRNPYEEPLLVHVLFPERYRIRVELLGLKPQFTVKHSVHTEESDGFARRIYFREEQAPGTFERKQKGRSGMDVTSFLAITDQEGKRTRRSYSSRYYAVPEVFWVGKGVQPSELPTLPEGATGWLLEGQEVEVPPAISDPMKDESPREINQPTLTPDPEHIQL